jgi:hypothetical protein
MKKLDAIVPEYELSDDATLREYFCELLEALWQEGEGFSGKRPLGDSGWQTNVALGLIKSGVIPGIATEEEFEFEWSDVNAAVHEAIAELREE